MIRTKPEVSQSPRQKHLFRRLAQAIIAVAGIVILGAALIFLWPVRDSRLEQASRTKVSYQTALTQYHQILANESHLNLRSGCGSLLLTHGAPTQNAVVMFHGYTACPGQFASLAQYFFTRGYNVYVPRAPDQGLQNDPSSVNLRAYQLTTYANTSITLATGLGQQIGVIGISGGADLATWASQYRPDVIRRLEVISPFYQPGPKKAPSWEMKPLAILYGHRLLPDEFDGQFSYYALAQYVLITRNYPARPPNDHLQSESLVLASDDNEIDKSLAKRILTGIASANHISLAAYNTDPALHLGHDIVTPNNPDIHGHAPNLYPRYFALYQGSH